LNNNVVRNHETAYRNLDNEGLIMNPIDSMLHSLNEVGCYIWEYISQQRTISEIVDLMLEDFDCDRETAEKDVLEFLAALQKQGLVKVFCGEDRSRDG